MSTKDDDMEIYEYVPDPQKRESEKSVSERDFICDEVEEIVVTPEEAFQTFSGKRFESLGTSAEITLKKVKDYGLQASEEKMSVEDRAKPNFFVRCSELEDEARLLMTDIDQLRQTLAGSGDTLPLSINEVKKRLVDLLQTLSKASNFNSDRSMVSVPSRDAVLTEGAPGKVDLSGIGVLAPPEFLDEPAAYADLDKRILALEKTIGKSQKTSGAPMLDKVSLMESSMANLDRSKMEKIAVSLRELNVEITAYDKKATDKKAKGFRRGEVDAAPLESLRKIDSVYNKLPSIEAGLGSLNVLAPRLRSLRALHDYGASVAEALATVSSEQTRIVDMLRDDRALLANVEKSFKNNMSLLDKSMKSIDDRLAKIEKRNKK